MKYLTWRYLFNTFFFNPQFRAEPLIRKHRYGRSVNMTFASKIGIVSENPS